MPIPLAFLLGLQASGMVIDYLGNSEQIRMNNLAASMEQAGITANISASRLESEDASLQAMKNLRENLGTQAAMLAARGTRAGAGSALVSAETSIGNFNADERMRTINQLSAEAGLKAGRTLSQLHQKAYQNKVWGEFKNNIFNKIPISTTAWENLAKGFSSENSYGFTSVK